MCFQKNFSKCYKMTLSSITEVRGKVPLNVSICTDQKLGYMLRRRKVLNKSTKSLWSILKAFSFLLGDPPSLHALNMLCTRAHTRTRAHTHALTLGISAGEWFIHGFINHLHITMEFLSVGHFTLAKCYLEFKDNSIFFTSWDKCIFLLQYSYTW